MADHYSIVQGIAYNIAGIGAGSDFVGWSISFSKLTSKKIRSHLINVLYPPYSTPSQRIIIRHLNAHIHANISANISVLSNFMAPFKYAKYAINAIVSTVISDFLLK